MPNWRNYDEAMAKARSLADPVEQQFVMLALTAALQRAADPQTAPVEPVDLLFLVDLMRELCQQRKTLARLLAGEDLRWWSGEPALRAPNVRIAGRPRHSSRQIVSRHHGD